MYALIRYLTSPFASAFNFKTVLFNLIYVVSNPIQTTFETVQCRLYVPNIELNLTAKLVP
jgi:hypothetical protein